MKKYFSLLLALMMTFSGVSFAQNKNATKKPDPAARAAQTAKERNAETTAPSAAPVKKDGTPDKRYKANKKLKKDGTPDKRYKENKAAAPAGK